MTFAHLYLIHLRHVTVELSMRTMFLAFLLFSIPAFADSPDSGSGYSNSSGNGKGSGNGTGMVTLLKLQSTASAYCASLRTMQKLTKKLPLLINGTLRWSCLRVEQLDNKLVWSNNWRVRPFSARSQQMTRHSRWVQLIA